MVLGCSITFLEVPVHTDMVMVRVRVRVFQSVLLCFRGFFKFLVRCKGF